MDNAYDPEAFRVAGRRLIDRLADYLACAQRRDLPVLPWVPPNQLAAEISGEFTVDGGDDIVELLLEVVARSNHLHHPRFMGHQVSSVLPLAVLADATSSLLNNGMAVYEMGQMHTVMERRVIGFLAAKIGFPATADGVLTHGGSIGNLTALLAARQAMAGHDVWREGQRESLAVLVSDQAHYCIARSVQCMGWGAGGAIAVPTDERFRMRVDELPSCLARARREGRRVIAVVASSCTTATGSFDPLPPIAEFCAEHGLWLHVDGAHGASLALSEHCRGPIAGIERADSVVWDLHKLMALPALNTAVLFRDARRSYEAFAQEASYLFEAVDPTDEWFDIGRRTMECTKRGLGMIAYTVLRAVGTGFFARNVERLAGLAQRLNELLVDASDFEVATPPEINILCFRHRPAMAGDLDAVQARIRARMIERGRFYITQSRLRGALWLRVTLMNPATTEDDLCALIDEVRAVSPAP